MGKTTTFNEQELYIVRQAITDLRNAGNSMISSHWAHRHIGNEVLGGILAKLEHKEKVITAESSDSKPSDASENASEVEKQREATE